MPLDADRFIDGLIADALSVRPRLPVDEWADRYGRLVSGGTTTAWSTDKVPYMRGILQAAGTPGVRRLVIKKPGQVGGTEVIKKIICEGTDAGGDSTLIVMPTDDIVRRLIRRRLLPTIRAIPRLSSRLTGRRDDETMQEIAFADGSYLRGAGCGQEHNLESDPFRRVIVDELDRCLKLRANVVEIVESRTETYRPRELLCLNGTPELEGHGIDAEYMAGDRRRFGVPCPSCGHYYARERFTATTSCPPEDPDRPDQSMLEMSEGWLRARAHAICPQGCVVDPTHTHWQALHGIWFATNPIAAGSGRDTAETIVSTGAMAHDRVPINEEPLSRLTWEQVRDPDKATARRLDRLGIRIENPQPQRATASFAIHGMDRCLGSPNPIGELWADFKRLNGRITQNFANRKLGDAWSVAGERIEAGELREQIPTTNTHPDYYRFGECHPGTIALTLTIDVQIDRLVCRVRGYGEHGLDTCLVWYCEVPYIQGKHLVELDTLARSIFPLRGADGVGLRITGIGIDSGYNQADVYAACQRLTRLGIPSYPTKGAASETMATPWHETDLAGKRLKGDRSVRTSGVTLLVVNADFWKTYLLGRMRGMLESYTGDEVELGRWLLPEGVPPQYLDELLSEERKPITDRRGGLRYRWGLRPKIKDNHVWDCEYIGEALADAMRVRNLANGHRTPIPIHTEDIGKLGPVRRGDDPTRVATAKTQVKTQRRDAARTTRKTDPKLREMSQLTGQALDFLKRRDDI